MWHEVHLDNFILSILNFSKQKKRQSKSYFCQSLSFLMYDVSLEWNLYFVLELNYKKLKLLELSFVIFRWFFCFILANYKISPTISVEVYPVK